MHHFFVDPSEISEGMLRLRGQDGHHLKTVLRAEIGEEVLVSDGQGTDYLCEVAGLDGQEVLLRVRFRESPHELPVDIFLFQAIPKADRMELVVQKAVELGVHAIVPMETSHVVVRLDEKRREAKRRRWQAVAEAAAKQSKRSIVPEVLPVMGWGQAMEMLRQQGFSLRLFPYENAEDMGAALEALRAFRQLAGQWKAVCRDGLMDFTDVPGGKASYARGNAPPKVAVFIGPEGGFSPEEVEDALRQGFRAMTLGKRILRTETAAICVLSILMFAAESAGASSARQERLSGASDGSGSG